jgi:hypothetical protein
MTPKQKKHRNPEPLTAEDGTVLKPKEATVVDPHGNTVFEPEAVASARRRDEKRRSAGNIHVIKLGWPLGLLLLLMVPVMLAGGFVVFALLTAFVLLLWSLRALYRALFQ